LTSYNCSQERIFRKSEIVITVKLSFARGSRFRLFAARSTKKTITTTPPNQAAYQDFLTPWKDTEPDIPILKQAKAEYEKLQ
jgi:hypothetical protein